MDVVMVVIVGALVGGIVAGALAWRLPNFDPAAPRAAPPAIQREVRAHAGLAAFLRSRVDPAAATGLALTVALGLVIGGAIAVGALLVMEQHNAGLAHYDLSAANWGHDHATKTSTQFLRNVSQFGGTPVMIAVAVIAAVAEFVRTRMKAVFGFMAVVVIGQVIVTNLTKVLVDRPRPPAMYNLTGFSGASFPSGHAATAAATYAAIALLFGRRRSQRTKALLAAAAAAIAVGVATTRVLLGVHWVTDVLAGLAVGWAWFAIASIAFGGRVLEFGRPVEVAAQAAETVEPPVKERSKQPS